MALGVASSPLPGAPSVTRQHSCAIELTQHVFEQYQNSSLHLVQSLSGGLSCLAVDLGEQERGAARWELTFNCACGEAAALRADRRCFALYAQGHAVPTACNINSACRRSGRARDDARFRVCPVKPVPLGNARLSPCSAIESFNKLTSRSRLTDTETNEKSGCIFQRLNTERMDRYVTR